MTTADLWEKRRATIGANVKLSYREPLHIVRGSRQYLYDETGRRYLDAYNNVPHVGHAHPGVTDAVARQMALVNTNTRYLSDRLTDLAERLIATLPDPLRVCYFVNSGSEANELALRLARTHTGRMQTIVQDVAYHGNTTTLVEVSPYKFNGPGGAGKPDWVHVVPLPDVYRGMIRGDAADAGERYAEYVAQAVGAASGQGGVCAFLAETCPSVGGQIICPPRYLTAAYDHVRRAGGVCIADEVQTAYGRLGSHFYAFEAQQVVPDIVVLGKPIGNGYPLGAVITTREIAESFDNGMEFFSTFGGSTVSCAAGIAVLDILASEALQAHAQTVGDHLIAGLRRIAREHELIGEVRGAGFFIGVELVDNPRTLAPATKEAGDVVNRLRAEGVLIGSDGVFDNVLKIRPPMPFETSDADLLISVLDHVLADIERSR
jgi:4-aminobutyrate aminotransferase-like enzyme